MARRTPNTASLTGVANRRSVHRPAPAATVPVELLCAHWQRTAAAPAGVASRNVPQFLELRLQPPSPDPSLDDALAEDARHFLALHGVIE
ncbi:MAG: hypothetical protein WCC36_02050 [Gammaproteobacteria bacterium]